MTDLNSMQPGQPAAQENADVPPQMHLHLSQGALKALRGERNTNLVLRIITMMLYMGVPFLFILIAGVVAAGMGGTPDMVQETVVEPGTEGKIALISLSGAIMGDGSHMSGNDMVSDLGRQFRKASEDDDVKAVLLQIDSPGGGLTASDILYNELQLLRKSGKPVVVLVGSYAASGGYYVAAPADYIVAGPTSLVGSFGVIMNHMQVDKLLDKVGVAVEPIKSTEMKDIGSPYRAMSKEEKDFFEQLLNTYHARFVSIISQGRGIAEPKVRELANGKVYTADQALKFGLIDKVGYFDDALAEAKKRSGLADPYVVRYETPPSLGDLLGAKQSFDMDTALRLLQAGQTGRVPSVQAIWTGRTER